MEIQGVIIDVLALQSGTSKNGEWKKQDFILETQTQYPKKICISMWGDKINESLIKKGEVVTVQFDLESREYNGKWYTDVKAWGIRSAQSQSPAPNQQSTPPPIPPEIDSMLPPQPMADDLPF